RNKLRSGDVHRNNAARAAAVERSAFTLPTAVEKMMANRPTMLRSGAETAALMRQSYIINPNLKPTGSLDKRGAMALKTLWKIFRPWNFLWASDFFLSAYPGNCSSIWQHHNACL